MLGGAYVATLAPGLTFWDSGELIAAVHALGVPHAPGTPLYVLLARAFSDAMPGVARAMGTNLFSAACAAAAGGVLAWLAARWMRWRAAALAAALAAGSMSSVWLVATETEVYAASLLLSALALLAADRAGASGDARWVALTAYVLALAVPLHLGALVAAPAAVMLAAQGPDRTIRWGNAGVLAGVAVLALAVGLASPTLVAGATGVAAAVVASQRRERVGPALAAFGAAALALTVLAYLPVRAAFDPAVNAGNPQGWREMWELVGRRQYGSHAILPRQAPLWAQAANLVQYLDWQVGLGLSPGVRPSWLRSALTAAFAALAALGAVAHRRRDPRSWRAWAVLVASGTAGLLLYLNFKAGASLGYGVLPDSVPHEVRERDYFFVAGFWSLGAWAGVGAVELAAMLSPRLAPAGVLLAALPLALNWRAADRSAEPAALLPRATAVALLESTPPRGVLATWGDNDSFPLWYLQVVDGVRPDVTVVTTPLLGTVWYRAQLARRDSLLPPELADSARISPRALLRIVERRAREQRRPFAYAITVPPAERGTQGGWVMHGLTYRSADGSGAPSSARAEGAGVRVDTAAAVRLFANPVLSVAGRAVPESTDPTARYFAALLDCPRQALRAARSGEGADSLDSRCNFR